MHMSARVLPVISVVVAAALAIVAFYGYSYTLGTMASSPDKRWSTIVSRDHG
jgi:hypothetical protein